ncbi:MAG: SDR family NAD(P)-dependent oxidoreductase [Deltaproteobacteria bacterium]|nr:SDR family NAD(P)-dependent oxidoreductase [Deltaproteobacteria bacterium]
MESQGIFDLAGKVALVTAGGHGLGREYCLAMAEFGADVACNDIDPRLAEDTAEAVRKLGRRAVALPADVSKPDAVESMVKRSLEELGTIDILFCNAGIMNPLIPLHELSVEAWDRVVEVNLTSMFLCIKAVLPGMLAKKRGSIISTASVAGIKAGKAPFSYCYGATKAGMIGFTRHAAMTYARDGVRINAIAPGLHDTRPVGLGLTDEQVEQLKRSVSMMIPMGRFAEPNEIRGLAVFLASDASSYVTGQVFATDGGITA